jgi:hypothetical protein
MRKRHATDDVDTPIKTLCGREPARIDNVMPDCATCLRVIKSRPEPSR